uniref:Uncharacterized protein n=1 Tax=Solanum lycopersicum TaxID=4081 RepID=A0A3Q7FJE8_SOLLC|nr:uncharacterized protein LOC101244556 [Solanum lycopersicum]XP_025885623.1 uncharacterized protein LOC101244556 [Solanum lycopersicum]
MCVEDALLQLQVTVKRASKTIYQVIHLAWANAVHSDGFDSDRLLVRKMTNKKFAYFHLISTLLEYFFLIMFCAAEAFLRKGLFKKRLSNHAKGKYGLMVRPECRMIVVLREITSVEEAEIAKLRVSNFKKLTKRKNCLVPHKLIKTTPIWNPR